MLVRSSNIFVQDFSYVGLPTHYKRSRYSDWLRAGRPRSRSSSPYRVKNFLFSTSSRQALGPAQPPIQWVPGLFPLGLSSRGVKLTTHLQLVRRSRKYGSIHSLPHTPSWRSVYLVKHGVNFTFYLIHRVHGLYLNHAGFLVGLYCDHEDEGVMFRRKFS
jgi:hypothetical protein